jgi:hypothetical protein
MVFAAKKCRDVMRNFEEKQGKNFRVASNSCLEISPISKLMKAKSILLSSSISSQEESQDRQPPSTKSRVH